MSISFPLLDPPAAAPSEASDGAPAHGAAGTEPRPPRLHRLSWTALRARHLAPAFRALLAPAASTAPLLDDAPNHHATIEPLEQLAATLDDVLWVYEPHSARFLYASPAYEREWQRHTEALYADSGQWLTTVHADDQAQLKAAFDQLARGEGYAVEYRRVLRSGAQRWIAEKATPVVGHAGRWPRFAGTSHDITSRKVEQLERLRSARAQDEFLAILSHELRTPLQPIRAAAALLALPRDGRPLAECRAVSIIERQVDHVARLLDDLLDMSRINFGKFHLHSAAIRIGEVIESALVASQALIDARRLTVRHTGPTRPVWVQGDIVRLTQVFSNLLHNAAKFSPPGGMVEIGIHPDANNGEVMVSVRDEGIGMAPDLIGSVFDLYVQQQQPPPPCDDHGGMGIGLAVVRSLVQLHGGRVSVQSAGLGCGSVFTVTLPAADGPAVEEIAHRSEPAPSCKRSVLLVDDNRDAAESMQALLELEGHAVAVAFTGQSALDEAARVLPDVVILDLNLPDIHGCEVARRLRVRPHGPLLFALTGSDGELDRQAVRNAGFDRHFVKPVDVATLLQALSA